MVRIDNQTGMVVTFSSLGASIYSVLIRGPRGEYQEVTLNHRTVQDMVTQENPNLGKTCGRVAGRIAGGSI